MKKRVSGSFRDPSGFLFWEDKKLYRQIDNCYQKNYDSLVSSGLYDELVANSSLIKHKEVEIDPSRDDVYRVIQPEVVPFISYPYEWSFSQLKDAALLTLNIHEIALKHGMSLKDASAYNVQFLNGKPIFIDTLSFEQYSEGKSWVAYKQFCQHFLAPLLLMVHVDVRLSQLLRVFIDGVPVDLASNLLPFRTKISPSIFAHIHLHASMQKKHSNDQGSDEVKSVVIKKQRMLGLIDNLRSLITKLQWTPEDTEWGDYYEDTNYSAASHENKKGIVHDLVKSIKPTMTWDLGANTGVFSHEASKHSSHVISWDIDNAAVEKHYLSLRETVSENSILPLYLDLSNPSAGGGWAGTERDSLEGRGKADLVLALALIHHLVISNNVPLPHVAHYFSTLCDHLIIEFVPKSDSQVQRLLATREDIFANYTQRDMEQAFGEYFSLLKMEQVVGSERTVYLYKVKSTDSCID